MLRSRHLPDCPAEDHTSGAWVPYRADEGGLEVQEMCDGDLRLHIRTDAWRPEDRTVYDQIVTTVHIGRWGQLETWHACRGCRPRPATEGAICEQCHLRLAEWLGGEHNLAWAYGWLDGDREPGQAGAGMDKITNGSKVAAATLNLHVHDLRQDLAKHLGQWLRDLTSTRGLTGPAWWAYRVDHRSDDESSWRSWLPQNQAEITDAVRYLAGWQQGIEDDPQLVATVYDEARELMARVASVAPWQAHPRRLPGIPCPACERDALAMFTGDEHVTCVRCGEIIPRDRYDLWLRLLTEERIAS